MKTRSQKILPTGKLTLRDRLSRLTFLEACKLLGPEGRKLIQQGANLGIQDRRRCLLPGAICFASAFPVGLMTNGPLNVSITLMAEARNRLHFHCNRCEGACEHVGAAFSLILEEKTALGLAAPPPSRACRSKAWAKTSWSSGPWPSGPSGRAPRK